MADCRERRRTSASTRRSSRRRQEEILAEHTRQPLEKIVADLDRDFILEAEEAKAYGVVDHVDAPKRLRVTRSAEVTPL